jgi:hypothetical protein
MLGLVEMFGGVFVLRRVAAADVAALEAHAKVHPGIVHFETFLAAFAAGRDLLDFFLMGAGFGHESPQDFVVAASVSRTAGSVAKVCTAVAGTRVLHETIPNGIGYFRLRKQR